MKQKIQISIVMPAYNEEKNIFPLYNKLTSVLKKLKKRYELIFVDDGSTDYTFKNLKKINENDSNVKVIQFMRHFEKAAALSAGFSKAKGDIIITMDADLQDNPEEIPKFLNKLDKGYDLVIGWRYKRKDPLTKIIVSKIFNFFVRLLTRIKVHDSDCNFRAMKREVIKNIDVYSGLYRYIPFIASKKGYKISEIKVTHHPRKFGKSKYGFIRLYKGFLDLLTIKFLLSYNKRPLHLFGGIGILFFALGSIIGLYLLHMKYFLGGLIKDRPLLILALLLIVLGIQFISIGLIGEMITFTNQKREKQYIIKREL